MKFNISFLLLVLFSILSCSGNGGSNDSPVANSPSNLSLKYVITGSDSQNTAGDGSGVVTFTAKADNATSYKFLINGETINSTTGSLTYTFTTAGTNNYTVFVSAYNGDKFISTSSTIAVKVSSKFVWSDEFNTDGAPDQTKWSYETGTGQNGWGNNELQYYTNRLDNAVVSNGTLKINLKKESYQGSAYTSARLVSKGKYDFKYGTIEFRAKLPTGGGTWPALWMLGSNYETNPWPACGEIDVMEHIGNQPNKIFSTLHLPGNSGGNALSSQVSVPTATSEFHIYSAEWNSSTIKFYVDGNLFFTYNNSSTTPFNNKFFIIMNMAMGGNFGGTADPNVTAATMEVDYVRVYQ